MGDGCGECAWVSHTLEHFEGTLEHFAQTVRVCVTWPCSEGGPGSDAEGGNWTVVHRGAGPPAERTGEGKSEGAREAAQRTAGFDVVVAADAQAVSDRSRRVYGEPPPLESAAAPVAWEGMKLAAHVPNFGLMLTVAAVGRCRLNPRRPRLVSMLETINVITAFKRCFRLQPAPLRRGARHAPAVSVRGRPRHRRPQDRVDFQRQQQARAPDQRWGGAG